MRSCINALDRLRVPPIRRFADEKLEGVGAVVLDRHFLIDGHGDDTIDGGPLAVDCLYPAIPCSLPPLYSRT